MNDIEFVISRMELAPGDILVVSVKEIVTNDVMAQIRDYVSKYVPGNRVLALDGRIELSILTAAQIEASLSTGEKLAPKNDEAAA